MKKRPQKGRETPHVRVNYEDHRLSFLDWVDHLGSERNWLFRFFQVLIKKYQFWKVFGALLFSFILAYAVMFEIRTPLNFQVGEVAKWDVVSPSSFELVDELTTEEKRARAEEAVPVIFDFDPTVFERTSNLVYLGFRNMRAEMKSVAWPTKASDREVTVKEFFNHKIAFEKDVRVLVPDHLFEWLVQNQFGVRVENIVIENLRLWNQAKLVENLDKSIPLAQNMVLARTVSKNNKGKEFTVRRTDLLDVNSNEAFKVKASRAGKLSDKDLENIEIFSRLFLAPNLTLNKQEMASRRQGARESVLPVTISVKKNQAIVPAGNAIQPIHLQIFKKIENLRSDRRHGISLLMLGLTFFTLIIIFNQYLTRFSNRRLKLHGKDLLVMCIVALLTLGFVKFFLFITEAAFSSKFGELIPSSAFLYAAPVAMGPMLVGLLITSGEVVWIFTALTAILMGILSEFNFAFAVISFASGIAGARGVYSCKKRNDIYWAGVRTGLVSALMIAMMITVLKFDQSDYLRELAYAIPSGFFGGILASMIAMMVVPLLESIFNYTTDVKLLELSNLNHPLLKEMIVKSPGTYHHSMLVGSMVEAAAEEIGGNPLLGKVMCYYHDIGKVEHSNYFIENQKAGHNPHDHISPYMSKTLLIAHVKDGVELGKSYKLGQSIIDGILQHHGTTLISFFYNKAIDARSEGDTEVSEEEFRYPGPKPQFREAALCMLADSIEAAARSLDEPTPVRLQNIVRNIIQRKFMEGQLDECSLTLRDLSKVELAFTRILLGVYHQRIDYPKAAGGGAGETSTLTPFFSVQGQKR